MVSQHHGPYTLLHHHSYAWGNRIIHSMSWNGLIIISDILLNPRVQTTVFPTLSLPSETQAEDHKAHGRMPASPCLAPLTRKNANICAQTGHEKGGKLQRLALSMCASSPRGESVCPFLEEMGRTKGSKECALSHMPGQPTWFLSSKPGKGSALISKHPFARQPYKSWPLWFLNSLPDQQHNLDWRMSSAWVHQTLALALGACWVVFHIL